VASARPLWLSPRPKRTLLLTRTGVWFVDFAPLTDPQFVPSTVASALGLTINSEKVLAGLAACLLDKQMLIVLDSCEHVIDAAASLAEQVIGSATGVHILATSREPLRAKAERVHRLPPLASPPSAPGLTAAEGACVSRRAALCRARIREPGEL